MRASCLGWWNEDDCAGSPASESCDLSPSYMRYDTHGGQIPSLIDHPHWYIAHA